MDLTQILIVVTLSVTTIFMVLIGYQVIQLFREIRALLTRTNTIIEGFERIGAGVENGFNEVVGFVGGLKSIFKVLEIFQKRKNAKQPDQPTA